MKSTRRKVVYNEAEIRRNYAKAFLEQRFDLSFMPFISVDSLETVVIEDAFFVIENSATGGYTLFVAINDVTSYIKRGSELDEAAIRRPSSSRMIPHKVAKQFGSFQKLKPQIAIVARIEIDAVGTVINVSMMKAKCATHTQLSFKELKNVIENHKLSDINPIDIHTLKLTHSIAHLLRLSRLSENRDLIHKSLKREADVEKHLSPEEIVRTIMSFANLCVAKYTLEKSQATLVKPAPQVISDTYNIRFSKENFRSDDSLGLKYCDFTSPLRKYSGMVIHRIVKSTLSKDANPYTVEELKKINERIEKK